MLSDDEIDDYTKALNVVTHLGDNNQITIYHSLDEKDQPVDEELTFEHQTIYHHKHYLEGIKFTPKNMPALDGKTCIHLNPIAANYIENLLHLYKHDIIHSNHTP